MSRILLVDDNSEWLSMLKEIFLSEGYEVDAEKSGQKALEAAKQHTPDLIFTDLLMPEMDGFTLCQKLKALPGLKDVPVIFCSGYFDEKDQKKLEDALGVSEFIRKPARVDEILKRVKSMLGATQAQQSSPHPPDKNEPQPKLQEIYNTTMLAKLSGMVDMLHEERQTYKDLLLRFHSLTDSASDAILIVDADGNICYWNKTAESCFQYTPDEVLEKPASIILPEPLHMGDKNTFFSFLKSGSVKRVGDQIEFIARRKDSSQFPAELSLSSWQEKGETYQSLIIRDVTERKLAYKEIETFTLKLMQSLEGTIAAVARMVEARDPYTAGHQQRVAKLAVAIATEMGLSTEQVRGIELGAEIHDIGKIQLPAEILSKPGRLSELEYTLIQGHAQIGYDILKDIEFPWPVADIAHQHHERLDGSGYPQGLKGDAICLEAAIVAVADVVEAMSSHRPYRPGLGVDAALKEIESKRGLLYHPATVDACIKLFRENGYELEAV
ncbi:HD domain-containing phosphohydrolase [Mariprofundus ferrooxydans]|uniref:HD domain-containing phosphohydrolase n=1 Tax=Mariprofundus ferrooxydans TaxID=314344 RepID=UPI0014315F79|nr:HD domain-containing phosphohydrolase [Mariprofundus ferrooxydans]